MPTVSRPNPFALTSNSSPLQGSATAHFWISAPTTIPWSTNSFEVHSIQPTSSSIQSLSCQMQLPLNPISGQIPLIYPAPISILCPLAIASTSSFLTFLYDFIITQVFSSLVLSCCSLVISRLRQLHQSGNLHKLSVATSAKLPASNLAQMHPNSSLIQTPYSQHYPIIHVRLQL